MSLKEVGQMAGRQTQLEPYRPLKAQKGKRPPRASLAHRPPGPEEEDPRVKCRDCGAFGHKASSSRCPMKHWGRALDLQALGSRKLKENIEPRSQQDQQKPGPLKQAEREKGEGPRQARQREALLQRFPRRLHGGQKQTWKDCTESCSYVRRPHTPMPVYTTKRASVLEPPLPWEPPTQTADVRVGYHSAAPLRSPSGSVFPPGARHVAQRVVTPDRPLACQPYAKEGGLVVHLSGKRPRGDSLEVPQAVSKVDGVHHVQAPAKVPEENARPNASHGMVQTLQNYLKIAGKRGVQISLETGLKPRKKARWSPFQHHHKSIQESHLGASESLCPPAKRSVCGPPAAPLLTGKTPAPVQVIDLQPAHPRPLLETVQACIKTPRPLSKPTPGTPLRMVFTRLDKACWSSRFLTPPLLHPAEKSAPPGQGPPVIQKSEGFFGHVPVSVLHEDLQVSSSSEDSERE
ncbi:putative protein FAM90A23P [Mustela erminea]|uniref:putative protein FAM90A23P n=1 Tax=Mustela erminea TaxID=36723 RepID=UPI0013871051|nr:putative protein FAM90A23P [Mustela erminea]